MTRASTTERFHLVSSYESVRLLLLDKRFVDRLDKPLGHWALPQDRQLPAVLLDCKLRELLAHPLEEISATPGVGQRKLCEMIKLLVRATKDEPSENWNGNTKRAKKRSGPLAVGKRVPGFEALHVAEWQWVRWKESVVRHGVESVIIGRLAPALVDVPKIMWQTPLSFYLPYSLLSLRELKSYGAKRVGVVLEAFHLAYSLLQTWPQAHVDLRRMLPGFAGPLEQWLAQALAAAELPHEEHVRKHLTLPLLAQVKIDVGDAVYKLAEGRLGIRVKPQPVRIQSRRLGVTRARVYQLLEECNRVMAVRWPEGGALLTQLAEKYDAAGVPPEQRELFEATRELFFPSRFAPIARDADHNHQATA